MPTRRAFLKYLAGLGISSFLSWNALLPKTAISRPISRPEQQWKKNQKAKLSFVVASDIHIARPNALRNFSSLLDDNYNSKPDAMVVVGDLGDGLARDYDLLNNELSIHQDRIDYPIYWTIGNHEFYGSFFKNEQWSPTTFPNGETDALALERFLELANRKKVYGETWVKDYHFIFLGTEKSRMSDLGYLDKAYLSDAQLAWLQKTLDQDITLNKHKPIFVFLHQPIPYSTLGGAQQGYVIQWQKLNAILAKYPKVIFFNGHTHYGLDYVNMVSEGSYTIVNSSSLASPIDRSRKPIHNWAPGLVVEVYDDKVEIKGREFLNREWVSSAEICVKE